MSPLSQKPSGDIMSIVSSEVVTIAIGEVSKPRRRQHILRPSEPAFLRHDRSSVELPSVSACLHHMAY